VDLHDRKPPTLSEAELTPGAAVKLAGRYRLTSRMSRSGLADLWKAEDEVLGRPVVAKLLRSELSADTAVKRLFRAEALAAARLSHSNIISVFDTGEHNGVPFLVMEYLGGGSLRGILDNGPINPLRAAEWGAAICAALAHAHEAGILHRDVRPENVLFTETGHLKVTDFAIGKAALRGPAGAVRATGAHSPYAPPESIFDERGDLYSLGVLLFECLVGKTPDRAVEGDPDSESASRAPRPGAFRKGIPVQLDAAVMKLLARDPAQRFQTAASIRSTLEAVLDEAAPPPAPAVAPAPVNHVRAARRESRTAGRRTPPEIGRAHV
jgi:serine/threonine protein kinase